MRLKSLWSNLFRKQQADRDLDVELRCYTQILADEKIKAGMNAADAHRQARIELGGTEQVKEQVRDVRAGVWLDSVFQDLRYALRMLRKSPGFSAVAILTLALGIGANTAIFSLVYTLLLRTLPVRDPAQLVELLHRYPGEPHFNGFSPQTYQLMRDHNHVFSGLIAAAYQPFHVRAEGLEPQTVEGGFVHGAFFRVLGVKPAVGRLLGPEDDHISDPNAVAVVSWSYWKSRFNLDPAILGKQIIVEDVPVTVVGVTSRAFSGLQAESSEDLWLPLATQPTILGSDHAPGSLWLIGRLKPGVSMEQAHAEMAVLYHSTLEEQARTTGNPFIRKMKFEMEPAGAGLSRLREQFAKPLLVLMAVVSLLLLIACSNVASMLLARGAAREHELALRVSLGASRFRLVRQVLTESLLLSVVGCLFGLLLAYFGATTLARIIVVTKRVGPPIELHVRPDAHVLLFTAGVALLTGVLFGLVPALRTWGTAPGSSLRRAGAGSETRFRRLLAKSLVVAQVALSVVLLSAAGLFVRHLSNLEHLDLGFQRDHILLVSLDPVRSEYDAEQRSRAYQELLGRLEAIPGVRSATLSAGTPISGAGASSFAIVEGREEKPEERRSVSINWVAPKYFATLGTPLFAGRDFNFQDQGGPRVAVVNQTMARYYFGDRDPIGKHVALDRDWKGFGADKLYEIIGVVGDAKYWEIREQTSPTIYFNTFQEGGSRSRLVLRTSIDPVAVAPEVRRAVRDVLKTVFIGRVTTLVDQIDASIVPERLIATLSGWFGVLGSMLTAIGLYGLLAYTVARRTHEIGVRMAVGATRSNVTRMVLGDALGMVCAGMAIGAPVAAWSKAFAARVIAGLPAKGGVPIAFGGVAMITVALLAAYLPARRAALVDPMIALRHE